MVGGAILRWEVIYGRISLDGRSHIKVGEALLGRDGLYERKSLYGKSCIRVRKAIWEEIS